MKLLHVSDFHARREWFAWLHDHASEYDLVCFTGDLLDLFGDEPLGAQVVWISSWVKSFPGNLLWCAGNHDLDTGRPPVASGRWMESLPGRHAFSRAGRLVKQGMSFTRLDWHAPTPIFLPGDIVLAHAPPCGWQTAISAVGGHDGGNPDLRDALRKTSGAPRIIFSGHTHNPASWQERQGKTWSFNPGFNPNGHVPNHTVIDTEKRTASWFCDGRLADKVALD